MKKLFQIALICLMSAVAFDVEAGGKDSKHKSPKHKKHKKYKKWKSSKKGRKSIPIDGGLSLFLLAGGAAGVAALKRKKVD